MEYRIRRATLPFFAATLFVMNAWQLLFFFYVLQHLDDISLIILFKIAEYPSSSQICPYSFSFCHVFGWKNVFLFKW